MQIILNFEDNTKRIKKRKKTFSDETFVTTEPEMV